MSGSSRMPKELTLGPQEYRRIQETSRWQVELDMIMANCEELDPEMKKKPGNNTERIDGIEYTVELDEECRPDQTNVRLRMIIPEDYPNSLPRVYPVDYNIYFDHKNHTYRDKKGEVHMCMLFEEDWTEDCTLAGLMVLSAIWMHKWMIWRREKQWPGKGRAHCRKCGNVNCRC